MCCRPPVWFMCSTSVNHLLLVFNCIMNFVVYCCFNDGFKRLICGSRLSRISLAGIIAGGSANPSAANHNSPGN